MRPSHADDVLVQVLPAPKAEDEAIGEERRGGGGRLRHDRRSIRIVGQVTAVRIGTCSVLTESPPRTLQTNGLCPWREVHGWK